MAKEAKDALGQDIIVDDGTPKDQQADHPDVGDLKHDDRYAGSSHGDAEVNDPPVRTGRPDQKIVQRLGVGAGQHNPTREPGFGPDGRYYGHQPVEVQEANGVTDTVKPAKAAGK
jgi:hypothetical protein